MFRIEFSKTKIKKLKTIIGDNKSLKINIDSSKRNSDDKKFIEILVYINQIFDLILSTATNSKAVFIIYNKATTAPELVIQYQGTVHETGKKAKVHYYLFDCTIISQEKNFNNRPNEILDENTYSADNDFINCKSIQKPKVIPKNYIGEVISYIDCYRPMNVNSLLSSITYDNRLIYIGNNIWLINCFDVNSGENVDYYIDASDVNSITLYHPINDTLTFGFFADGVSKLFYSKSKDFNNTFNICKGHYNLYIELDRTDDSRLPRLLNKINTILKFAGYKIWECAGKRIVGEPVNPKNKKHAHFTTSKLDTSSTLDKTFYFEHHHKSDSDIIYFIKDQYLYLTITNKKYDDGVNKKLLELLQINL